MLVAAANAVAEVAPSREDDPGAPVLPPIIDVPKVSRMIAKAVAREAVAEGHAPAFSEEEIDKWIQDMNPPEVLVPDRIVPVTCTNAMLAPPASPEASR